MKQADFIEDIIFEALSFSKYWTELKMIDGMRIPGEMTKEHWKIHFAYWKQGKYPPAVNRDEKFSEK